MVDSRINYKIAKYEQATDSYNARINCYRWVIYKKQDFTTHPDKTQFCTRYYKNWPIKMLYLSSKA